MNTIKASLLNIIILNVLIIFSVSAQNKLTISGKIIDASTGKPVEFANLGVEDTFLGTASDIDGKYTLLIDDVFSGFNVIISAVGYQSKKIKVKELASGSMPEIKLTPAVYGISEVDILAHSRILYGIIKSTSNLITTNYLTDHFSYSTFYSRENKKNENRTEAVITITDDEGYGNRTYTGAFINRSYEVNEIRRNFDHHPVEQGNTDLDRLLIFDIVRVRGNILDSAGLYKFDLKQEDITSYAGDSVWVISYKTDDPDFSTTGNKFVTGYSGVIYISKSTSAVLRNEIKIEVSGYFPYGYTSFFDNEIKEKGIENSSYNVTTSYRRNNDGKHVLSSIHIQQKLTGTDGSEKNYDEYLKVLEISKTGNNNPLHKREYYSGKPVDKKFWERFTIPETD